jgi:hypothetical protein
VLRSPRLPLQIGTSALTSVGMTALLFMPGSALAVAMIVFGAVAVARGALQVAAPLIAGGAGIMGLLGHRVWRSFRERPSDLYLDDEGMHVEGGRFDGVMLSWPMIAAGCRLVHDSEEQLIELYIDEFRIAEADDPAECESLQMLHQSLQSELAADRDAPAAPTTAVQLLRCPRCDLPVVPSDAERVRCRACDAEIEMPPALREKARGDLDLAATERRAQAVGAALGDQPRARTTEALFVVGGLIMVLAWPLAIVAGAIALERDMLPWWSALLLLLVPPLWVAGPYILLRRLIATRFAVRLISVGFAAHAPTKAGEPSLCRECGAPLPDAGARMLASCAYCGADNVLGVDLRGTARRRRAEIGSIDAALALRDRQLSTWRPRVPFGAALIVLGIVPLVLSLSVKPERPATPAEARPRPRQKPELRATAAASPLEQLTHGDADLTHAIVSADGRWLVAEEARGERTRLIAIDRTRDTRAVLAPEDEAPRSPSWARDGEEVLYLGRDGARARPR